MAAHKRHRTTRKPAAQAISTSTRSAGIRLWLLAGAVGLSVARVLVPPEAIETSAAGLTLTICWLLLATAWPLSCWWRREALVRLRATDWAVMLLIIVFCVSGLAAIVHGAPRPAINAAWQWITAGVIYLLIRQLVRGGREARAVVAVMIALAVGVSLYGLYQYAVELPAVRQQFAEDPGAVLRQQSIAPGSTAHRRLEDRIASTEPFATFALTNSLAGFLVPWLTLLAGLAFGVGANHAKRKAIWVAAACFAIPIAGCLLLTKSRGGYLAAVVGIVLAAIMTIGRRNLRSRPVAKISGICVTAVALLVLVATLAGGLDIEIVTQATRSLGYRVQYWQSSLAMIGDYPVLGCGPGNFQDTYTRYKLPRAAEEVADPHNFVVEIWATGGTLALLALLALSLSAARDVLRRSAADPTLGNGDTERGSTQWIFAGAIVGAIVSTPLCWIAISGLKTVALIITLATIAGSWFFFTPWISDGRLPRGLPAAGVLALLCHLLAAGGIGIPAVAVSLWLLLALATSDGPPTSEKTETSRSASATTTVVAALLLLACYLTAYRPVMNSRAQTALAHQAATNSQIEAYLRAAAAADPLAAGPQRALAGWWFARWQQTADADRFRRFAAADGRGLALSPRASAAWRQSGQWYRMAHAASGAEAHLEKSVAAFRRAVELYPHNAVLRGELAVVLDMAGRAAESKSQAGEALRLDAITPHADQKLPDELRRRLARIMDAPP